MNWEPNGGHMNGRKLPYYFAASLLDRPDMFVIALDAMAAFNQT